jgi:arabinose-5-phosphate isomerase
MSNTQINVTHEQFISTAIEAINTEIAALSLLTEQIDDRFAQACDVILACQGRVVVTGMGKSGLIGRKRARPLFLCILAKQDMVIWVCW